MSSLPAAGASADAKDSASPATALGGGSPPKLHRLDRDKAEPGEVEGGSSGISIEGFLKAVVRDRTIFAAVVAGCFATASALAFIWPVTYESRATISTLEDSKNPQGVGGLGGLGALSGMLLDATQRSDAVAMATFRSSRVTREFVLSSGIGKDLFPDRWDAARNAWLPGEEPQSKQLETAFRRILTVEAQPARGIYDIAVQWRDPVQAADWVNRYIAFADLTIRKADLERSRNRVAELMNKLGDPANQSVAETIRNAALIEMQSLVSAEADESYRFRVIDPGTVPIELESPKRLRIMALGLLLGVLAASLAVMVRARQMR